MTTATRSLLAALLGLLLLGDCYGTHLTGGDISYAPEPNAPSPFTYVFTLRLYRDTGGVDSPNATLDFGVQGSSQTVAVSSRERVGTQLGNSLEALVYQFRYTYPAAGTYIVRFTENSRNPGVVNLSESGTTPFHIETSFTISPTLGTNRGPQLLNPPIFRAVAGQKVCMNPAAFDADGDSLAYRLVTPLGKANVAVNMYQFPNQITPLGVSESGGAPVFSINAVTGEMCWDAPGLRKRNGGVMTNPDDFAQYAIAFVVEEWRNGSRLSAMTRDFAITVAPPAAPAPELRAENVAAAGFNADRQVRVEPGQRLTFPVLYKSQVPNVLDSLVLVSETGAPYGTASATARDSAGFTKVTYSWTPTEANRRRQPYLLVFRGASIQSRWETILLNDLTFSVYVGTDIPTGRVTATEDEVNGRKIRLFPNPTRNKVRLAEVPGAGAVHFQLTDASGRQAYTSPNLRGTNFEMDLSTLPNGLYAYTIRAGQRVVGKGRLLKQ
jgi:hypothetical protein